MNAAVAQGVPPSTIAGRFDTATICLSKGLGCPLGALLAGSAETIERAWREKHLFGGAMRQTGMLAAAVLYSLDHHMDRLVEGYGAGLHIIGGRVLCFQHDGGAQEDSP